MRDWSYGLVPKERPIDCGRACGGHDLVGLNAPAYAYLLGIYLGDGCLSSHPRNVWRLRLTLDAAYPGIIAECCEAIDAILPGRRPGFTRAGAQRAVDVSSYPIVLEIWQDDIVAAHPKPFLRGLIHSDGTRIIATERKGKWIRRAPRYAFSNRSADILRLFATACDRVGVHHTRASWKQIAVYSRDAVARLDEFIGPKT